MTDKQKQQKALERLMRALNAPTSFCAGCMSDAPAEQQHLHHHAPIDRAHYALILAEAARPALEALIADNAELKRLLALPGCSEHCIHVHKEES